VALWTPLDLSAGKLLFYYDATINASLTYATGTTISGWADQGPNAINLSQSTTAYFPQVQSGSEINGNQAVLMAASESTGGGQFLEAATSLPAASTVSTLFCGSIQSNGTYGRIFSLAPSGGGEDYAAGLCVYQEPSAEQVTVAVGGNFGGNISISGYGTPFLLRTMIEAGSYEQVLNGTSAGVNSVTYTAFAANPKIAVGNDASSSTASYAVEALVGTLVGFTGTTTSDNQMLEGWAAWKFGLQTSSGGVLPSGHPYYSAPPMTGASTVALQASGIVSARGSATVRGSALMVATGTSRGASQASASFSAMLFGRVSSPSVSRATIAGRAALTATAGARSSLRGAPAFWAMIAARFGATSRGAGQLGGVSALSARGSAAARGVATLSAAANLVAMSAASGCRTSARGALSLAAGLAARVRSSAAGQGAIAGRAALTGRARATSAAKGPLTAAAELVGLVARTGSVATARAFLSVGAALSGRSSATSAAGAALRGVAALAARSASTTAARASLRAALPLIALSAASRAMATGRSAALRLSKLIASMQVTVQASSLGATTDASSIGVTTDAAVSLEIDVEGLPEC
jgi:hypothetical protein